MLLDIIAWVGDAVNLFVLPVIVMVALVAFLFGILRYVSAGDDEEKRNSGRNFIVYGIIGLFVMVSVWGLVAILNRTLGIGQGGSPAGIPVVSGQNDGAPPAFSSAAMCPPENKLDDYLPPENFTELVCLGLIHAWFITATILILSLAVFLYGVIKYVIIRGGDERERSRARNFMLYGIIALFVMASVWGLVAVLNRSLGIGQGGSMSKIELKGEL